MEKMMEHVQHLSELLTESVKQLIFLFIRWLNSIPWQDPAQNSFLETSDNGESTEKNILSIDATIVLPENQNKSSTIKINTLFACIVFDKMVTGEKKRKKMEIK